MTNFETIVEIWTLTGYFLIVRNYLLILARLKNRKYLYFCSLGLQQVFMGALIFLFIWLHQVLAVAQGILFIFLVVAWELLVVACGILVPLPGSNPGLLHWKHRSLAAGPPGKSPHGVIKYAKSGCISQSGMKRKEENKNRMSQSPFWGTAFCLDASLLHVLSGQDRPQASGTPYA